MNDFSADPFIGKNLQEYTMRDAGADKVDAFDALLQSLNCAVDFGEHPLANDAALFEMRNFLNPKRRNQ